MIQTIGNVEAESVNIEFFDPSTDCREDMLDDIFVAEIQFDKVVVAFPAFIPQTVVVIGVPVKGNAGKPAYIWGSFPVF